MNSNNLWEAIGKIDDKLLNDAIELKKKKKNNFNRMLIGVAAAFIIIVVSFSTAYTVSAQFREWVITLFQIKKTEIVPNSESNDNKIPEPVDSTNTSLEKDHISLYAADTIEDIFTVQYLKSDNYMNKIGPLFFYSDDLGSTEYYTTEKNEFIPIESDEITRKVTLQGITGNINYTRINYNGSLLLQENERDRFMLDDENDAIFVLGVSSNNEVWLTLYKNPQSDQWAYPAKYNLETGEVSDIFLEICVDGIELTEYPVLRNWNHIGDGKFVVSLGRTMESAEAYLIDTNEKKQVSLSELTGLSTAVSAKVVDDKIMLLEPVVGDKFNYYCYDYSMNTVTQIYNNAKYWSYEEQGDSSLRVRFSGGRYDFIEETGIVYLVDEFSGARLTVEGITEELAENLVINCDNDKILVSSFGDDVIQQFGFIDMKAGTFYLINRENQYGIHEYSIGWNDANHVIINATDDNHNKSYVYLYSLME